MIEKFMELQLLVLRERKNIYLARQITARQGGEVIAFIPYQPLYLHLNAMFLRCFLEFHR